MNPSLDINTPRGQQAAADQMRAADIVFHGAEGYSFLHTRMDDAAAVDGFIVKDGLACGVAEIKSRDMSIEQLTKEYDYEWILTFQKLKDIADVCRLLHLPGYGMVYLKPSMMVLVVHLTSDTGQIMCRYRVAETETQKTCNSGKIVRENAYIQMRTAKVYRE